VASVVSGVAAWAIARLLEPMLAGIPGALAQVLAGGIAGLFLAIGLSHVLGVDEVTDVVRALGRRLRRPPANAA
jgi:hypothetical protein